MEDVQRKFKFPFCGFENLHFLSARKHLKIKWDAKQFIKWPQHSVSSFEVLDAYSVNLEFFLKGLSILNLYNEICYCPLIFGTDCNFIVTCWCYCKHWEKKNGGAFSCRFNCHEIFSKATRWNFNCNLWLSYNMLFVNDSTTFNRCQMCLYFENINWI